MLSKGPKWPLGAEAPALSALSPFNLHEHLVIQRVRETGESSSFFIFEKKKKNVAPSRTPLCFSSGYLVQPNRCAYIGAASEQVIHRKERCERGVTADNGMETWRQSLREKREKAFHFARRFVSRCNKREMKSEGCQVKESKKPLPHRWNGPKREKVECPASLLLHRKSSWLSREQKDLASGFYRSSFSKWLEAFRRVQSAFSSDLGKCSVWTRWKGETLLSFYFLANA